MYIIYGLINDENTIYYIGSTKNIKQRIRQHRYSCKNQNDNNYKCAVYDFIRNNNLEINYIILEENISNENKYNKEREWIEKYDNLHNSSIPGRNSKIYYQEYKEKIKKYNKEYYENNLEKIKERDKKYYEDNKEKIKEYKSLYQEKNIEKIKEYRSKPWTCEICNKIMTLQSKHNHLKLHNNN